MGKRKMTCSCGCGAKIEMAEECFECPDKPEEANLCVNCTWRVEAERLRHLTSKSNQPEKNA